MSGADDTTGARPLPTKTKINSLGLLMTRTTSRHIFTVLVAALLVYVFGLVHEQWSPMHRWNKATADAAFVLLTFTMLIGPVARLCPALRRLIPLRREAGIYAIGLAIIHTVIILDGWVEWDFARLFGFEFHPTLGSYVMLQHGFGLANLIGVVALAYGVILMITSNDMSVRTLGGSAWKLLHSTTIVLWTLVVVHTAYFLFFHFLDFHRPVPDPNPLQWVFVWVVVIVLAVRGASFFKTWRHRKH
ncbi:sulfoxide reductase heme-binding subunit YedZ [Natronocella acetinitrilica]|uniref:Sulfoxide reductase heme-binding subunit YedZ n=1 Tax=Natronocella acetinitrilica TaxID=414046 RepID=A0AAE3KDL9_9GAMM|nr:ferric reductase-like transmembrane domain-containing protein [Natronocella acetinitrilica]MCP1676999.1 sulfoxide reductase heme-binding subunit YedZ [Natronocella acetinitrilica]